MMKSVYGKLIGGFLITIIFSFSVAGYITLRSNYEQIEDRIAVELEDTSLNLARVLVTNFENVNKDEIIKMILQNSDMVINVLEIPPDGASSKYSIYGDAEADSVPSKAEMLEWYQENSSQSDVISDYQFYGARYDSPVYVGSDQYIGVYVYAQKDISQEKATFTSSAILIFGCIFLSGSVVFLVIADVIVKPITRLTNATRELSKGNYGVRVNYTGDDEISRLNQGFNQMAQQLAKQEETRQKFISDISHEFQTPLTAIQGFANILKEEDLPKEQREKYADIVLFHSKRLSTLSKNMLQLTLLENEEVELEFTNYSVIDQLARVISTQENQAILKDIEIQFSRPKKDILIDADEQRMEQVWINVISNAIKYTDNGGLISVSVKRVSKFAEVCIEDTGRGMTQEVISHIFERFYREEKARSIEGNGLGLSIVKSIVELHNGKIDVVSQIDVGSTFIIKIPVERTMTLRERLRNK